MNKDGEKTPYDKTNRLQYLYTNEHDGDVIQ